MNTRRSFIASLAALLVPKVITITPTPQKAQRASLKALMAHKKNTTLLAGRGEHNSLFAGEHGPWQGHVTYRVNLAEIDLATWDRLDRVVASGNLQFGVVSARELA